MPRNLWDQRRLLIADDEAYSRELLSRMIRSFGAVHAELACDGLDALELLSSTHFDAAIIDFHMPGATGLEVIKAVRSGRTQHSYDLPCVMLTGLSDRSLLHAAIQLEVDAFVIKPVTHDTLKQRLETIFTHGRDHSPMGHFLNVDVEKQVTDDRASAAPPPAHANMIALAECPVGAVLARNLLNPNGSLLLARGTVLNRRLLDRLSELQMLNEDLDEIWVVT